MDGTGQMGTENTGDAVALIAALFNDDHDQIQQLSSSVARSRTEVTALGTFSTLLTGEQSMIDNAITTELTCEECEASLPGYVDAWLAGALLAPQDADSEDADTTYAALHHHLRSCPACATTARELHQIMASTAVPAPSYRTFAETRQQVDPTPSKSTLWQSGADQIYRLVDQIAVVIEDAKAHFDAFTLGLTPQLVPATMLRNSPTDELVEVLELPHPEQDFVIRLRMGALQQDLGTLALQFATLSEPTNLADIKVTLRDDDGSLLESTRSDQDGLALFDALEPGKYQLQIEHSGQVWLLGVTIAI